MSAISNHNSDTKVSYDITQDDHESDSIETDSKSETKMMDEKTFSLHECLVALANDNAELAKKLNKDEDELSKIRQHIVSASRKNFILERELSEIDDRIKLLIKNRITVQEVLASQSANHEDPSAGNPLAGKRGLYEDLFYILQSKPRYFAALARLLPSTAVSSFVQTVVFDMYGDQYDTREERLLLDLFRKVLKAELYSSTNKSTVLRANTAITQMLSAYARRGQGLSILKDILEEPLRQICASNMNLETDPLKVYQGIINDEETKTGQPSTMKRDVTTQQAKEHPEVQRIAQFRVQEQIKQADMVLTRIINGVESIPYGMRWICKQLGQLSKERFPDADQSQIGSLIGGYIYLRFFNPVIVAPDSVNFVQKKPNKIVRRNLIVVASLLQKLSNGLLYSEDTQPCAKQLNEYLESKKAALQDYFDRLVAVDDLADSLQVDKYLEHTNLRMNMIHISFNQLQLIHSLLEQFLEQVTNGPNDPLRAIMHKLGKAPAAVDLSDNRIVALQLTDRRDQRLSTTDAFAGPSVNPLYLQAKALLLSVLRLLPLPAADHPARSLIDFLEYQKKKALNDGDTSLADHITNVVSMLHTLAGMNLLKKMETPSKTFDNFLWEIASEAVDRANRVITVKKRLAMVDNAMKSIQQHHEYLLKRLELYRMYLENVKKGGAQDQPAPKKKEKEKKQATFKITHQELEEQGIIVKTDPNISRTILKRCYYQFRMAAPGEFEITLHLKKGIDVKLMKKPIELTLEDLLKRQEDGQATLGLEYIDLNINLLLHLLNSKFIAS